MEYRDRYNLSVIVGVIGAIALLSFPWYLNEVPIGAKLLIDGIMLSVYAIVIYGDW